MSNDSISRRSLLKGALVGLAAVPATALVARSANAAAALVDPNDAQAKSLGWAQCKDDEDGLQATPAATRTWRPAYRTGRGLT